MDRDHAQTTCILWTSAQKPPHLLAGLLGQRGFRLVEASDRFDAMASACSTATSGARTVLILDQVDQLHGANELIEALRGRLPEVVIWTFDEHRRPQLASLDGAMPNKPANGALLKESTAGAPLRLVGEPPVQGVPGAGADPGGRPAPEEAFDEDTAPERDSVLSSEELEMLLSDEHDQRRTSEPTRGRTGGKP